MKVKVAGATQADLCPVRALIPECFDLETLFVVCRCVQNIYLKVEYKSHKVKVNDIQA